jgi:hypothetical protein
MIARHKTKKKYVRGYGTFKSGSGIFDRIGRIISSGVKFISQNKDAIKNVGEAAVKVGINTKNIVQELRKPAIAARKEDDHDLVADIEHIISRINNIRTGSGFHYV